MSRFPSNLRHIQPNDPVTAGVASAPDRALEKRTNQLRDMLDSLVEQRALVHRDAAVAENVMVGQPVFWNEETQRYEQAFADIENDEEAHTLVVSSSADAAGLCYVKTSATRADIVLYGLVKFSSLSDAISGGVIPGRYYLSQVQPGKLVRQRPAITVVVARVFGPLTSCDTDIWVLVQPQTWDAPTAHTHYRFELVAAPAGEHTPPAEGESHTISSPDETLQGWLPADHVSFGGRAPNGAKFGYNMAAHPEVERAWPPMPLSAALMLWDKGDGIGGTEISTDGVEKLVTFDRYGIWWMSNCYNDVPWPTLLETSLSSSVASETLTPEIECPRYERMRIIMAFMHMIFSADRTVVTSLQADVDQPIEYVDCDGDPANTGDLFTRINLALLIDDAEYYGGLVFKEIVDGRKFGLGWAAEGLVAGSDRVLLSSSRQRYLTPGNAETAVVHQGIITVDVDVDPAERMLSVQIAKLNDTVEQEYLETLYIGFQEGRTSSVVLQYAVPPLGLPTNPMVKIRTQVFGMAAGPFPALTVQYRRIARAGAGEVALDDTLTAVAYPIATASVATPLDTVIEVETAGFTVAAGDTVFVTIERDVDAVPEFVSQVGLIRADAILYGTEA